MIFLGFSDIFFVFDLVTTVTFCPLVLNCGRMFRRSINGKSFHMYALADFFEFRSLFNENLLFRLIGYQFKCCRLNCCLENLFKSKHA